MFAGTTSIAAVLVDNERETDGRDPSDVVEARVAGPVVERDDRTVVTHLRCSRFVNPLAPPAGDLEPRAARHDLPPARRAQQARAKRRAVSRLGSNAAEGVPWATGVVNGVERSYDLHSSSGGGPPAASPGTA
jgi:hypothetical protein